MVKYEIYTDGAYSSKNNTGGVGIVILRDGHLIQKFNKAYKDTTNNKMELMAVIFALKSVKQPIDSLTIYSDSMYKFPKFLLPLHQNKDLIPFL